MKKKGQICCFDFITFKSKEPDPTPNDKRFIWPDLDISNSLCLIIGNIDPKNVYVQNSYFEKYTEERHKPYLCYFLKEKKCFVAIESELAELK